MTYNKRISENIHSSKVACRVARNRANINVLKFVSISWSISMPKNLIRLYPIRLSTTWSAY